MAYFKIEQPNQPTKWIKSIDRANGTLEFSETRDGCFQQDSGFYANSEFAYLKFHFMEAYPELEYLSVDCSYGRRNATIQNNIAEQIQEAPNEPQPLEGVGVNELAIMDEFDEEETITLPWGDVIHEEAPRPMYVG